MPPRIKNVIVAQSKIIGFHPRESPHLQNNTLNEVIARYNQLRLDLGFSP
jgi:hypothetical protein